MCGLEHLKKMTLNNIGTMSPMKMKKNCGRRGLEELDKKDFWFSVRIHSCNVGELAKDYIMAFDEFERICKDKGILEGNVIFAVLVTDFPDLKPEVCNSMKYVGIIEV